MSRSGPATLREEPRPGNMSCLGLVLLSVEMVGAMVGGGWSRHVRNSGKLEPTEPTGSNKFPDGFSLEIATLALREQILCLCNCDTPDHHKMVHRLTISIVDQQHLNAPRIMMHHESWHIPRPTPWRMPYAPVVQPGSSSQAATNSQGTSGTAQHGALATCDIGCDIGYSDRSMTFCAALTVVVTVAVNLPGVPTQRHRSWPRSAPGRLRGDLSALQQLGLGPWEPMERCPHFKWFVVFVRIC